MKVFCAPMRIKILFSLLTRIHIKIDKICESRYALQSKTIMESCPSFSIGIHLEGNVENDFYSFSNLFLLSSVKSSVNILSKLS